ncbi:MAG: hypothetical protein MOB07_06240 [Acidobacteria bacterium]|nr:hypothetical protein [Acidobacteriota bacterium]
MPDVVHLIGATAYLEDQGETLNLDYTFTSPANDEIRLKFLQFAIQEPLFNNPKLWSPGSGQPYFSRKAVFQANGISHFRGCSVRAVITLDGGMGICVDVTNKFVSTRPLPVRLIRNHFGRVKGRHYIYHYGYQWHEIPAESLSELDVIEYLVPDGHERISLLEFICRKSRKPLPFELAQLPPETSVICYRNNQGDNRAAPSALCYQVYAPHDVEMSQLHRRSIISPDERRKSIHEFTSRYLQQMRLDGFELVVEPKPLAASVRIFQIPDLEFGNSRVLSVRGTRNTQHVTLENLGQTRLALLKRRGAGFYDADPLGRQYFIIPQTVADSYGDAFLELLKQVVDDLFPQENGYQPEIITYNDRVSKTFPAQGKAILDAVQEQHRKPGHAVVMIHPTIDRRLRDEDQLAAMVLRKMRELDLPSAVMHTSISEECFEQVFDAEGKPYYQPRGYKRGKLTGYLRGVAINKVLLNNHRWPFVLYTRLHADLVIGVDVKNNTAGFVVVSKNGGRISFKPVTSKQREKLTEKQMRKYLIELVKEQARNNREPIRTIVIHRDGKIFFEEIAGAKRAIRELKDDGVIPCDSTLTILEIAKSAPVSFRLFEILELSNGREKVLNPEVGYYYLPNGREGYLCCTGRAFPRQGTVKPLHVVLVEGEMSLEDCLEDIYYLSTLAWTRPEDCTRYPITIKLNDRFLAEEASEYDQNLIEQYDPEDEEDVA